MEHTESKSFRGQAQLSVEVNGRFDACFTAQTSTHSSVSEFATDDGSQHDDGTSSDRSQRLTGAWALDDGWLSLQVEGAADGCMTPTTPTEPFVIRGVALDAGTATPTAILALKIPRGVGRDLRLPVGVPEGWEANDLRLLGSASSMPSAEGWVLLGAAPGLSLNWVDERAGPTLAVEALPKK